MSVRPKLTIGMATFDDYDGVYFTIQAIKMYHAEVLDQLELLVVDNHPGTKISQMIENLIKGMSVNARYIPMAEPQGTTQGRNRVFAEAQGEAVMCIDSHVLLAPGSVAKLLDYYRRHPGTPDLLQGPMMYDNLNAYVTHFDDSWRSEMWGIWGRAWGCVHSTQMIPYLFSVHQGTGGKAAYFETAMGFKPVTVCPVCGKVLPELEYAGHEQNLINAGFVDMANQPDPFPIPGMGLGLFTCLKDKWLGFSPHFRGFGGEEMYIHEKYRQAGAQAVCLPWLKWGHRFGRPNGIPYLPILTRWNKIRNYVIGHNELGLPLDRVKEHFMHPQRPMMHPSEWEQLLENPIGYESGPPQPYVPPKNAPRPANLPQSPASVQTHADLMAWAKTEKRDLDQHLDKLAELAGQCQHVTEVTHRRESTVALLAAPKVVSFNSEYDALLPRLSEAFPDRLDLHLMRDIKIQPLRIADTDMLFLDTEGTHKRLLSDLNMYHQNVKRYIVIHDTDLFGRKGEDGGVGMMQALKEFMLAFPQWSIIYHTDTQHGLTVLGCQAEDKPKLPHMGLKIANFTKAIAAHVVDGLKTVSKEVLEERLAICSTCPLRNGNSCSACGCGLSHKAALATSKCPKDYWQAAPVAIPVQA